MARTNAKVTDCLKAAIGLSMVDTNKLVTKAEEYGTGDITADYRAAADDMVAEYTEIRNAIAQQLSKTITAPKLATKGNLDPTDAEAFIVQEGIEGQSMIGAADWIASNGDPAQRAVARAVGKRLQTLAFAGVKLRFSVVHVGDSVPRAMMNARGLANYTFGGSEPNIHVYVNGADVVGKVGVAFDTVLHELVHAATMGAVRLGSLRSAAGTALQEDVRALVDVTSAVIGHFNAKARDVKAGKAEFTEFERAIFEQRNNAFATIHETLAWALTDPQAQAYLESIPYKGKSMWTAFVQAVRQFLGLAGSADTALSEVLRVADSLMGDNIADMRQMATVSGTAMQIQDSAVEMALPAINTAEQAETAQSAPPGELAAPAINLPPTFSTAAPAGAQMASPATIEQRIQTYPASLRPSLRAINRVFGRVGRGALNKIAFTEDLLNRATGLGLKAAKTYKDLSNQRASYVGHFERQVLNAVSGYTNLPEKLKGRGPGTVNQFLYDSTMKNAWGYPPDWLTDKKGAKVTVQIDPDAKTAYDALGADGQAYVDSAFKLGFDTLAAKKETVIEATTSEYDALIKAAKDANNAAEVQELTDEKAAALKKFGTLLATSGTSPYVPLKRFGDYVVVAESQAYLDAKAAGDTAKMRELEQDEAHYFVDFAENDKTAQQIEDRLRTARDPKTNELLYVDPGYRPRETMRNDLYGGSKTLQALSKLRQRADAMPESSDDAKGAKDASRRLRAMLTDMYLTQLAESSARKSEIRRRGIAGDIDMIRSLEAQGKADANFLGTVKYGDEMLQSINDMRREMRDGSSTERRERAEALNEIIARHLQSMEYKDTPLVDKIKLIPSMWFLAMSPSYYIQNALQPWMLSLPVMAAKHDYSPTAKALVDAYANLGPSFKAATALKQFDFDTMLGADNKSMTAGEKQMIRTLLDSGRIDIGMLTELGGLKLESDTRAKRAWNKVDLALRGAMLKMEAVNRISTALAAYRLEMAAKGGSHETATTYADRIIQETHGDYSARNAPRAFNTAWGKIGLQFKKYQLIQLTLLAKMMRNSIGNGTREEKILARKALAFMLGQAVVVGGGRALPIPFAVAYVFGKMFDDDNDEPPEYVLRKMIGDQDIADLLINGPLSFAGVNGSALGGFDKAVSVMPFVDIDLTKREGVMEAGFALMTGPLGGWSLRMADGLSATVNGDYYKGLGMLLPKGPGSLVKAYDQLASGIYQRDGDVTMSVDEITAWQAFQTGIGFTPQAQLDRAFRQNAKFAIDTSMTSQSASIKKQYTEAVRNGESTADAMAAWLKYQANRVNMGYARQPMSDLTKSAQKQQKREADTVGNVQYGKGSEKFVRDLAAL